MTFKPNKRGIDEVFAEVARRIEVLDKDLRERYAGQPVDEIAEPIGAALSDAGVQFQPADVREYAEAVSAGEPFEIKLT